MLIEEIDSLNNEIFKLKRQNAKISELTNENGEIEYNEDGTVKNELKEGEWHIPYGDNIELSSMLQLAIKNGFIPFAKILIS